MKSFKNTRVLITGGMGFIGSNLAIALVRKGAQVTILDNMNPNQGGNLWNIASIKYDVEFIEDDIRNIDAVNRFIKQKDYVFHLARQTDHLLSLTDPYLDIDINIRGTTILLEALRKYNRQAKFIYTGTRGQYGNVVKLPVSERAPTNPRGIYEVTNLAAEKIISVYHTIHHISSVMLRLTNTYGPGSQMKHDHYGVANWFIRLALDGKPIPIYGDGKLKRDFLYVDDAVEAILRLATTPGCFGEVMNVGRNKADTFLRLARQIVKHTKTPIVFTPFSPERAAQEPGDFASDITKIKKLTGWMPKTPLAVGINKTIAYYKKYRKKYWTNY